LAIAVVGILILRSQGVATNVVEKLVDDKKNAELDAKDRHFRIEEIEEEKDMKNEMSENAEETAKDESNDLSKKQD
jgi:DNA-binding transcriptional MerR regulator